MVDYYAMPASGDSAWPGRLASNDIPLADKAGMVENAIVDDLRETLQGSLAFKRLIPYVVMHEYEALLFSDCEAFTRGIGRTDLTHQLQAIRNDFGNPEEINDSPETAPSKRIIKIMPQYEKVIYGNVAALEIGIEKIRLECPHFDNWLSRLETV